MMILTLCFIHHRFSMKDSPYFPDPHCALAGIETEEKAHETEGDAHSRNLGTKTKPRGRLDPKGKSVTGRHERNRAQQRTHIRTPQVFAGVQLYHTQCIDRDDQAC